MARRLSEEDLKAIEVAIQSRSGGLTAQEIRKILKSALPLRTLQYRLKYLVDNNRLIKKGEGRWTRYHLTMGERTSHLLLKEQQTLIPLSKTAAEIQAYINQPITKRRPVGYNRVFLDAYRPNFSAYLTESERAKLSQISTSIVIANQPAGTYAKQMLNRLLIDLS